MNILCKLGNINQISIIWQKLACIVEDEIIGIKKDIVQILGILYRDHDI